MSDPEVTEEQLAEVHPLVGGLIGLFDEMATAGTTIVLEDDVLADLRKEMQLLYEDGELRILVKQLLHLGFHMKGEGGAPDAGQRLLDFLEEEPLLEALKKLYDAAQSEEHDQKLEGEKKFKDFKGEDAQKKAPASDEEKPEGAVTLDDLDFPKRL